MTKTYKIEQVGKKFHTVCRSDGFWVTTMQSKNKKTYLFKLCWYLDGTPPAEQLLGFMLHVRSGNEEEILRTGNSYSHNNELPDYIQKTVNRKLDKVYQNTRKLVPFREPVEIKRKNTIEDNFLFGPITKTYKFDHLKEQIKRQLKLYVREHYPQFDNFAYQRDIQLDLNDQGVSTMTKDFKMLAKG